MLGWLPLEEEDNYERNALVGGPIPKTMMISEQYFGSSDIHKSQL